LMAGGMLVALAAHLGAAQDPPPGRIVYTRKSGDRYAIHSMNADGTGDREVPGLAGLVNLFPATAPGGRRLAVMSGDTVNGPGFEIAIVNLDGTGKAVIPSDSRFSGRPAWSPDGKQLAFPTGDERPAIVIADAAGGNKRQLSEPGHFAASPFWTRDGKAVGYTRVLDAGSEILVTRVDGSGTETLVKSDQMALAGSGSVSADGNRLTYLVLDLPGRKGSVRVWDFAAKAESFLADIDFEVQASYAWIPTVAWGPEDKSLLVSLPSGRGPGVYRYTLEGTSTRLTPEGASGGGAVWAPG